jgi:hypothetical protein
MPRFLFGMIAGALLMHTIMHYHVVRGNEGIFLVAKLSNNLSHIYVDTRKFDVDDWRDHRPVAAAIMKSNRSHLLETQPLSSLRSTLGGLVEGLLDRS